VKSRKKPGIKSTDEFRNWRRNAGAGESFGYVSGNRQDDAADPGQGDGKQAKRTPDKRSFSKKLMSMKQPERLFLQWFR